MDLVIDFCLREGKPWKRMSASQAKLRKAKRSSSRDRLTIEDGELDRILDESDVEEDETDAAAPS